MKKNLFVFAILLAGLSAAALVCGCKSTSSQKESSSAPAGVTDPSMPPWINDHPPSDTLWGIGVANNALQNMRMDMADARARQDLGRQLSTLVQGMVIDYAKEAGGIDETAVSQFQETVSRQVVDAKLTGAERDVMWNTPDNKTLWIRLKMSKADAAQTLANGLQKAIDSEAARYAEFKAMEALKMLDKELDKNYPVPQPVTR
jgi:hypothetical protein